MKTLLISLFVLVIILEYLYSPPLRELIKEVLKNLLLSDKLLTRNFKQLVKETQESPTAQPAAAKTYRDRDLYPKSDIFRQIGKTIQDQWYVFFFLVFLFIVVLYTAVGYDMLESIIDDKAVWFQRLVYLTFFLIMFCLAIWVIPIWVVARADMGDLQQRADFLVKTVLVSFISIIPYGIVATGFLVHEPRFVESTDKKPWLCFIVLSVLFCLIQFFFRDPFLKVLKWTDAKLNRFSGFYRQMENDYAKMLIYMGLFQLLILLIAMAFFARLSEGDPNVRYGFFVYILVSGMITFLVLYNISLVGEKEFGESGTDNYAERWAEKKNIDKSLEAYFEKKNKDYSRRLFWLVFVLLAFCNFLYFISPSLSHVNTLFIVLPLFAFNVVLFNYLRNLYRSPKLWVRFVAFAAIAVFFLLPFYSPDKQFNLNLIPIENESPPCFDEVLSSRLDYIIENQGDSVFYIVCGQGGGSRAGYVMAGALEKLDSMYPGFLNRTLMYSTVSGSSPGVYHYLKTNVEVDDNVKRREVYRGIYKENLNAGSVFGFFTGDNLDAATFGLLGRWILKPRLKFDAYYDRNERIKYEYDRALFRELDTANEMKDYGNGEAIERNLFKEIWASFHIPENRVQDNYVEFMTKGSSQPLHLINTMEVNRGKRAVILPGKVFDPEVFVNTILPLEDEKLVGEKEYMNIKYRDAVNLSELFPILSAAETINGDDTQQFVDGGYYENYGLTTALDVYNYLKRCYPREAEKTQIVLIKNSKQMSKESKKQMQLLAPLKGIMKAPFTGHANHMDEMLQRDLGNSRYKVIIFDEEEYDVPLTRGLTKKHIRSIDCWLDKKLCGEIEAIFRNKKCEKHPR